MSRLWFVVWAIVIWQVAVRAFAPEPTPVPEQSTPINDAAFEQHEKYIEDARKSGRKSALATLDLPWSARCGANRKQFVSGVNGYYAQRQNENERYPEIYGKPGADYIARQWTTPEDRRIERLTQEAYANGYLTLSDFNDMAGKVVAAIVTSERVTGRGCAA